MPANKKYLSTSNWQRFSKLSAGFLGGYLVCLSFHFALAQWWNRAWVLVTLSFTGFILWAVLLLFAFLAKSEKKIWGLYLLLTAVFSLLTYIGKLYRPY